MKIKHIFLLLFLSLTLQLIGHAQNSKQLPGETTWTFTYLKAANQQKDNLKLFLEKNWFVMDSIGVANGLFKSYELIENVNGASSANADWDYIVAVEYFTGGTYADIAAQFEVIRKNHQTVRINGLGLADLGKIVKSETVKRNQYPNK